MDWKIEYAIGQTLGYFSERHICRVADDRWWAEKGYLFVICDGREFGQQDGRVAKQTAETIVQSYYDDEENGPAALQRAVVKAHETLLTFNKQQKIEQRRSAELTILLILNQQAYFMRIGDDRKKYQPVYLFCKQEGTVHQVVAPTFIAKLVDGGLVTEEEILRGPIYVDGFPRELGFEHIDLPDSIYENQLPLSKENLLFLRGQDLWIDENIILSALEKGNPQVVCQQIFAAAQSHMSGTGLVISAKH